MSLPATIAAAAVAAIHVFILVVEMFAWDRPLGRRVFGTTAEFATSTRVLAANQGLYNGFLAAGIIVGLALGGEGGEVLTLFSLACVFVAGAFGAVTASPRIFLVQSVPASLAVALAILAPG